MNTSGGKNRHSVQDIVQLKLSLVLFLFSCQPTERQVFDINMAQLRIIIMFFFSDMEKMALWATGG